MNRWVKMKKYLLNCFLLTLPIMAWNIFLTDDLPPSFQPGIFGEGIPFYIEAGEQACRALIFVLTIGMPLSITSEIQKKGVAIYIAGLLMYFASWLALLFYPESSWSKSAPGFLSPAYTPLLWLTGIALIGHKFYCNWPYRRWWFITLIFVFLLFHIAHALIVYNSIHGR